MDMNDGKLDGAEKCITLELALGQQHEHVSYICGSFKLPSFGDIRANLFFAQVPFSPTSVLPGRVFNILHLRCVFSFVRGLHKTRDHSMGAEKDELP